MRRASAKPRIPFRKFKRREPPLFRSHPPLDLLNSKLPFPSETTGTHQGWTVYLLLAASPSPLVAVRRSVWTRSPNSGHAECVGVGVFRALPTSHFV